MKTKQEKQTVKSSKKEMNASEEKALALHVSITRVLTELYQQSGMTQAEFGRRMGYSRSQINSVLKNRSFTCRLWNVQHLVRASDVLGVRVLDVIAAAEKEAALPPPKPRRGLCFTIVAPAESFGKMPKGYSMKEA